MKKIFFNILILTLFLYSNCGVIEKNNTPDKVFYKWYRSAKKRDYNAMFKLEWFKYSNVKYAFNKYNAPKKWDSATRKEQLNFIKKYKEVLKSLLDNKNDDLYEALLRLKPSYKIRLTHYSVNLIRNTAEIWVAGDYPGEEKIRLIKVNNKWYLINPFGYHSYLPVTRTLLSGKKE